MYVGAGLIIIESVQTLLDLPILLLILPIALLTPYRIPYVIRDLKTMEADKWRMRIVKYLSCIVTDIPYTLMFLNVLLSVYMGLQLKAHLKHRLYNEDVRVGDIMKEEIVSHFIRLYKHIGFTIMRTVTMVVFIITCVL